MSLVASDVPDEDFEDLIEDGFFLTADVSDSGKRSRKKPSGKPPASPRSPYLSSMNVTQRRPAVTAWRPMRGTQGERLGEVGETQGPRGDVAGERGETARTPRENWLASLSNGHGLSQSLRGDVDGTQSSTLLSTAPCTPELLKQSLKKPKQSNSTSNDFREKEDMYDEIIHLKKSLQAQKNETDKMKAKLRRLEEDKTKKDKQIEQLLDPTKAPEYTLSLVDKKNQGSVVINGLKQRILKLEQHCSEKESNLSKLQSDLTTTNLEELKITVDTYFEEIQRLRMMLKATEKSNRADIKGSQRQQKVLSTKVLHLSENLKQLQQENCTLKEELNTDSPTSGPKGYKDWSKQRLLRRLVELDLKLEAGIRAPSRTTGLDKGVQTDQQTTPTHVTTPPEGVAVVMAQTGREELVCLKERVRQLEQEREELQEMLTSRDEEVKRQTTLREEAEKQMARWKNDQEKGRQQYSVAVEKLTEKTHSVEEEEEEGRKSSREDHPEKQEEKEQDEDHKETAGLLFQTESLEHKDEDIVLVQSSIRGHLLRQQQLAHLRDTHSQKRQSERISDVTSCAQTGDELVAVTLIQSVFRGHLTRSELSTERSLYSTPPDSVLSSPLPSTLKAPAPPGREECVPELSEEDPWPATTTLATRRQPTPAQLELSPPPGSEVATEMDSDNSDDDIIVSPSRPMKRREEIYF
ncbi:hypothetical protein UPYG_G00052580 [Umbra pygmaea]|uniref:IQ domain-containing protein E-like n=1 Tax=Umbra pygmaea TaxID=75934 RepID=A0ABD0X876_UMBPY